MRVAGLLASKSLDMVGVCLTDVLRRVRIHPAKDIATRTPCPWTEHRGAEPMRPDPFGR